MGRLMEIDVSRWSAKSIERWRGMIRVNSDAIAWMADRRKRHQHKRAEQRRAYKEWRRFMSAEYAIGVNRGYIKPRGSFKAVAWGV